MKLSNVIHCLPLAAAAPIFNTRPDPSVQKSILRRPGGQYKRDTTNGVARVAANKGSSIPLTEATVLALNITRKPTCVKPTWLLSPDERRPFPCANKTTSAVLHAPTNKTNPVHPRSVLNTAAGRRKSGDPPDEKPPPPTYVGDNCPYWLEGRLQEIAMENKTTAAAKDLASREEADTPLNIVVDVDITVIGNDTVKTNSTVNGKSVVQNSDTGGSNDAKPASNKTEASAKPQQQVKLFPSLIRHGPEMLDAKASTPAIVPVSTVPVTSSTTSASSTSTASAAKTTMTESGPTEPAPIQPHSTGSLPKFAKPESIEGKEIPAILMDEFTQLAETMRS